MNAFHFTIPLALLLSACGPVAQDVETTVMEGAVLEWLAPVHRNLEFYVNNHSLGSTQGGTSRPNVSLLWEGRKQDKGSISYGYEGEPVHLIEYQYKGTLLGQDHYEIRVSYPAGTGVESFTRTYPYEGVEIEFWKGEEWRMGMRTFVADPAEE